MSTLLKSPQMKVGIAAALMFQVIFSLIWMTAYNGVNDRVGHFKIAVVNEDQGMGKVLLEELQAKLPFAMDSYGASGEAMNALEQREVQMVMTIPSDFSAKLQKPGEAAVLDYRINGSNAAMVKSVMESAAGTVTQMVGKTASLQGTEKVLQEMNMPEEQAVQTALALTGKVESRVETVHPVEGMNNQMVPMMLVLASYVGAMIMGMNMQQAVMTAGKQLSRIGLFGARIMINVGAAFVISLVGTTLVYSLGGQFEQGFAAFWLFQCSFVLTFLFFSQMFLILFGMAGMLFNITVLSLQLVTSGALVPRQLLSSFYSTLGDYLPATYAVEGLMNIQFGGGKMGNDLIILAVIALISVFVSWCRTMWLSRKHQAAGTRTPEFSTAD